MYSANSPHRRPWLSLAGAWLIAVIASLSALFIGEVMGQTPCHLCWLQRAFMFPLAIVLGVACLRPDGEGWRYGLPLAICGLLLAGFHSLVFLGFVTERITTCSGQGVSCSSAEMTIFGGIPLPVLALLAFSAIAALLILARTKTS